MFILEKKGLGEGTLGKILKCKVETKWVLDVFLFGLFFFIALLIPISETIENLEIIIFFGIGFCSGIIIKDHSRFMIILGGLILVSIVYISKTSLELLDFIMGLHFIDFIKYFVHIMLILTLAILFGSLSYSIFNYISCRKGI